MKLKRFDTDSLNESQVMYFADKKPELSEENQKLDIIERLSQHWNEKLKTDFLAPRSLYSYSLDELKEIEKYYLTESNNYCDFGCNYISKFVEEHPEYDNEDFFEYVSTHNKADRDMGELQDISKEEIDRLAGEWKPVKESYYVGTGKEINKLPDILKDSGYGHHFEIKGNKLYFLASEDQETFDKIENVAKEYGYEIKLESVQFDTIDKNNIQQAWEYVKTHITKEDVEKMVKYLEEHGFRNYENFNVYNYAINRLISNIFGGGEVESLLRIENDLAKYLGYTFETQLDILAKRGYPNNIKPLTESKEDLERIANLTGGKVDTSKPSIFQYTIYRLPTEEELNEFADFPNLTAKDIENGFSYTIIGRGIKSAKNQQMIIDSIQMLIDKYPENEEYKKALEIAKSKPNIWNDERGIWSKYENYDPKLVEALHELKQQHSTNDAVEDIRIEGDEIVFDVKCETDVQSVTEYNGFKLRFNHLCNIDGHKEKSEEEILEHAKMIKEQVINQYIEKLFESPDSVTTLNPDKKDTTYSSYDDEDAAKPFAFVIKKLGKDKSKLLPKDLGELWVGDWGKGHSSDCPLISSNGGDYSYGDLFLGRLWFKTSPRHKQYDLKILSTWTIILNNIKLLQHIVSEIEKSGYDLSDWSYDTGEYIFNDTDDGQIRVTKTIPLKELGITFLPEEEKTNNNLFRKSFKKRTPLMYRQAIYGENKTYNFEEYFKKIKGEDEEI